MLALSVVAETDFIAALPKAFVAMCARRFGVASGRHHFAVGSFPHSRARFETLGRRAARMRERNL